MTCDVCGKVASKGEVGIGAYCSLEHASKLTDNRNLLARQLLNEPIGYMPDSLGVNEFERFVLKIALRAIGDMPASIRRDIKKRHPVMLYPEEMTAIIKEKVIKHVPVEFMVKRKGADRTAYGGTYRIKKDIPKDVVLRAVIKAELIEAVLFGEGS